MMNGHFKHKRREGDGTISLGSAFNRFNNLLNLVYLGAERGKDGRYCITEKLFDLIETELDFNPPETDGKTKKDKLESQKKRYRQRETYRFWKTILDNAKCKDDVEAESLLLHVFYKLDGRHSYGSMTHCRYALETLHLAIDDVYGTKKAEILTPTWVADNFKKPQLPKTKKAKSGVTGTSRTKKKNDKAKKASVSIQNADYVSF
jgi:hypothetical protein